MKHFSCRWSCAVGRCGKSGLVTFWRRRLHLEFRYSLPKPTQSPINTGHRAHRLNHAIH